MTPIPEISLVAVTDGSFETCARTVSYLARQTVVDRIELVIVGPSKDQIAAPLDALTEFLNVKVVEVGAVKRLGVAYARGIEEASAPIVAYVEEHDFPPPDWADVIIRTFSSGGYDAVGWGMVPSNPGQVAWAHIYGQFGEAVAPLAAGLAKRLGAHHAAYRRDLLLDYGDDLSSLLGNEGVLFAEFVQRGKTLYITGETFTEHTQISDFKNYLRLEFIGQRTYAEARMTHFDWPIWKRAVYILGAPLIPFVRLARALRHIHRTGRKRELLPQAAFIILAANIVGAIGEAVGYVVGANERTQAHRLEIELDRFSFVSDADQERQKLSDLDQTDSINRRVKDTV